MNEFRSLKILDLFQPLFKIFQIDYPVMRKIVAMKLSMDQRRAPTIFNQSKKKEGNQFLKSLGIYVLFSLILIPFIFGSAYMFQMSILFGILMFILMTTLISDFSSVLLDVRDKTILHTKPVSTRTVNAAKFIHITIYMIFLTAALIGLPTIVMVMAQGIGFTALFLVEVIFIILFIVTLTALAYIVILRFFSGEQLKDIINYVQIFLSVGVIVGYQIVVRVFQVTDLEMIYQFEWWHTLIPPIWFSAPYDLFLNGNVESGTILLSILAIIIPVIAFSFYYRLIPVFEQNLQKLMEEESASKEKTYPIMSLFERFVCKNEEERIFFRFSQAMMSREREFKLKVYPSIGMGIVFPFIFIFTDLTSSSLAEVGSSKAFLNVYFATIIIGVVVHSLPYAGKYQGAWIFQTTPIKDVKNVYSATLKAVIVKFYLPIFLFISICFIYIFSLNVIPDLLVAFITAILQLLIAYKLMNNEEYPFTKPFEKAQQGSNTAIMFLFMFLAAIFVGIHFIVTLFPYGVFIYLAVLVIITPITWKLIFPRQTVKSV